MWPRPLSITAQSLAVEEHFLDCDEEEARGRPLEEFSLGDGSIGLWTTTSLSLMVSKVLVAEQASLTSTGGQHMAEQ